MKKPKKGSASSQGKLPAKKVQSEIAPIMDLLNNLDDDLVAQLKQTILDEIGVSPDLFESAEPVALFAEYLELCLQQNADENEKNELLLDLVSELSELKVDANGGDPDAREDIQAIYDLLEDAIESKSLSPVDMMVMGKLLTDAAWDIPDTLKQGLAQALQSVSLDLRGGVPNDTSGSLIDLPDEISESPFDTFDYLNSILAALPTQAALTLLYEFIAAKNPIISQGIAGFLLHPDAEIAKSVAEALASSAKSTPVDSSSIERLVRLRPWLPQDRHAYLDAVIKAMRLNAMPPVKTEPPKIIKCFASVCDGSGTRSIFVTLRRGVHYQVATVMIKPTGVKEALVLCDLPKSALDQIVREMKASVPVAETDLAGVSRMLALAVADNVTGESLPPFRLVEFLEILGVGTLQPDYSSPKELLQELLARLPVTDIDSIAVEKAHKEMADSEFSEQWFETGEVVEDLLYPVKGSKKRIATLMKSYLPERRLFWAKQCAISALVLRAKKGGSSVWKQMALVGRDIASDIPLDQIPLMNAIAKLSVEAFEIRM